MSNFSTADLDFLTPSNSNYNVAKPQIAIPIDNTSSVNYSNGDDLADFLSPPRPEAVKPALTTVAAANTMNPRYIQGMIVCYKDMYDDLTFDRSYKKKISPDSTLLKPSIR